MRYASLAAVALALSTLAPSALLGQINPTNLSIVNFKLVSEVPDTRYTSFFTYRASLSNVGPALPSITATAVVQFSQSLIVVPGMGNLHFPPAARLATVDSLNTFTILVDRRDNFSFNQLLWSYNAPVANAGPDQTAATKTVVTLNGSGSTNPSGIGTLTYSWAFTTVPLGSAAAITNPTSVTPTFVPDILGIYTIALTVSNGAGTDTSTVNVNVNTNAPPPPVADAGPNQSVVLGATVHLDGSKSKDFNGNPLTYSWTLVQRPAGSTAVLTGANTVSPTFVADVATMPPPAVPYIAQLVVNDGNRSSPPAMVTITTGITQPVANAGPNQSVTAGATVQLDGSRSTDANSLPLTYRWSLISLPSPTSTAKVSNPSLVNPTFVADLAGMYIAQLIVNNGTFDSTPSTVTITANPQQIQKPIANAGSPQTVQIGAAAATPVVLTGSGSDPQSLPLTFHWTLTVPSGSNTILSNPGLATTTFVPDKLGQYVATLTVNNGTLNSDPSSVTITVTDTQPVANPGPPQNVTVGGTVTLDGSASTDFNHAPLTYRWSLTLPAGSGAILNGANTVSPTFVPDVAGMYVAQLIVNDGFQDSIPQTVTITATIGAANTIALSPNPLTLVGNPGTLTVTLGTAAGGSGQVVTLSGFDPTIATAPPSVTVLTGALSAAVTITPHKVGSTILTASALGFKPDFGEIDVVPGVITLTLSSSNVGVGNTVTGTITLNSPAPAAGVTVGLSLDKNGFVSLSTTSVTIPSGGTTGTFTVTGGPINAGGPTIITASANGYTSGTASITSGIRGTISLPAGLTVAPSQTLPIVVSVDQPVTGNPVTITLGSSDTGKLTITPPTVTIPVGSTTANAQVTGVNFGSANITATANGFLGATQAVSVAANLSFPPATVTVGAGNTANVILTLSAPAPAGGVLVTLVSDTPSVATVPSTVTILGTQTTATVVVTGVKAGNAKITASSSTTGISSATANIIVVTVLAIQSNALPAGVVGTPYASFSETASGGTPPYTFSATGLPAGLSINSGSGAITGTPTTAGGPSPVTITVTDSTIPTPSTASTTGLTITIVSPLTITSNALPGGTVGTAYTAPAQLVGGGTAAYTYTATGLPAGLSISSTTGAISGTPTAPAVSAPVTITATDSTLPTHLTVSTTGLTITIAATAVTITSNPLPNGTVGTPYTASETASGGTTPYTYTATGLPAGLGINAGTGAISGTPTAATAGAVPVTITATDSTLPTHQTASTTGLTITIAATAVTITSNPLPNGTVGTAYTASETASGGTTPYTYTATGLPAGLGINAGTGAISGTPTAATAGAVPVTITATDSTLPTHQTASTTGLTITIAATAVTITSNPLPNGTVGTPYTASETTSGGTTPYTYTATGLPAGLGINAGTGAISGTPTAATAGAVPVTITATDSTLPTHQTASTTGLTITIAATAVTITSNPLPNGTVGTPYTASETASGGTTPYTYTATGLPAGLGINAGTGAISGTPTAATAGAVPVTITATDSTLPTHQTASTTGLTITIAATAVTITSNPLPNGTVGTAYTASETASGGTTPYTYTATGLPAGLGINAGTGAISGTPTAATAGAVPVTITATDSTLPTHQTASTTGLTITIIAQLMITSTPLQSGQVGTAYSTTTQVSSGGTTPYTFTATGLPAGLTINAGTGAIGGTPTADTQGNSVPVTITVTDSTLPTHQTASTTGLTIKIIPAFLVLTKAVLVDGTVGAPYSDVVTAAGGNKPYIWSIQGLPPGLLVNSSTGQISGIPGVNSQNTYNLIVTVKDSSTPQLSTTGSVLLDILPPQPAATVTGGTVGQRLLLPITITLSQGSAGGACTSGLTGCVVLTSSNSNIVAVAGRQFDVGSATAKSDTAAGQTSILMYAVGVANSGSVTLTASIQGFIAGTSTVTASPSGFVLTGPNGVGSSFVIGANSSTPLTVTSVQLDSSGNVGQTQALAHQPGQSLVIDPNTGLPIPSASGPPVAVSLTPGANVGTVTPSTVTLTAGTSSSTTTFTAGSTALSSTITLNSSTACAQTTDGNGIPNGCVIGTFVTPAGGANVLPVTVSNLVLSCTLVTVGQNLENFTSCKLNGAAPAALTVNLTSNDPSKLLFAPLNAFGAPDPTAPGVSHVAMSIPAGFSTTASFYVYGVGNTGTVTYLADAGGGITGTGSVTLAKSGFVLVTPFGTGADFSATAPSSTDLTVQTAVLDSGGNNIGTQGLAGGLTASVNVTSSFNSVGTISGSPAMITAANNSAIVQFVAAAQGTTTITAVTPAGFSTPALGQGATVNAMVTLPRLRILTGNNSVGNNLELSGLVTINTPAGPTGVTVNLSITGAAALSATGTDAGNPNITVTIPANSFSTTFYIYGKDVQGTATVSASSPGFTPFNQLEQLTPSGVIVLGPLGQNSLIPWDINLSSGNQPFTVATAQFDATGTFVQQQPLAGANPLTVTLNDSVSTVGTVPDSISISPGAVANGMANTLFHPLTTGNTAISTVAPTGFTTPLDGTNMVTVRVH